MTNSSLPAAQAGIEDGMIVTSFNGESTLDSSLFLEKMYYCSTPGQNITLIANGESFNMETVASNGRGVIGVTNFRNERRMKEEYSFLKHPYYWTKELFRWLFLLNFFIGLFNLLPLGIVDGGRMTMIFLDRAMINKKKSKKLWATISLFFLLLLLFGLITTYVGNPFSWLQ